MKFYDREQEISELRRIDDLADISAQFTMLVGRRRTGKTTLLTHAFNDRQYLYFFVGKKTEQVQCIEFQREVETVLGLHIHGRVTSFARLLEEVMHFSEQKKVTLIIDEFQRLDEIGSRIVSDIQRVWDSHKTLAKIHIIACGSIFSMMKRIFEDHKEPLFRRTTARIELKPFSTAVLKKILADHNPDYTPEDLLLFFTLTGGVAKYVEQLCSQSATDFDSMLSYVCSPSSTFLDEGTELLVGEFGRKYQTYYSILQLIASGLTSQTEIDSIIEKNCGRYLDTLESQ